MISSSKPTDRHNSKRSRLCLGRSPPKSRGATFCTRTLKNQHDLQRCTKWKQKAKNNPWHNGNNSNKSIMEQQKTLPISIMRYDLAEYIVNSQVFIVVCETGFKKVFILEVFFNHCDGKLKQITILVLLSLLHITPLK